MSLSRFKEKLRLGNKRPEPLGSTSTPQPKATANKRPAPPSPQGLIVLVEGTDPVVDIVAVHGLNGHRERTWTANGMHWLRDFLPADLPNARILAWGYDANTHAASRVSCQYLYDHARTLVADLSRKRELTDSSHRPIIFVAHSLGGIIVKSALIHSDASREGALLEHRSIKISTHGILFMGTPHQGGNGVQLGRVLVNVASVFISADDHLLKHLERDSEWLQQQLGQYNPISREFVTKFAYEEYETPTLLGKTIMVVPRASAVVPGHADGEPIAMHANHVDMVRFASNEDPNYVKVSEVLQILARKADYNIRSRWNTETRMNDARIPSRPLEMKFHVPYNLNEDFVGRSSILEEVKRQLGYSKLERSFKPRSIVSLYGLGGVGKTQVALSFVYWVKETYPSVSVFWLHASSEDRFRQSVASIATKNKIPGYDDPKADVPMLFRKWLEDDDQGRWIMVIDNADDTELFFPSEGDHSNQAPHREDDQSGSLGRYIPKCRHGSILVTTRNKQTGSRFASGRRPIEVGNMTNDEADRLLRKVLDDDSIAIEDTLELSSRLEYLPLALTQAAAFLHENSMSIQIYTQLLDQGDSALVEQLSQPFEAIARDSETPHAVTAVWIISFEQIERQYGLASEALSLISLFDRQAIPEAFVTDYYYRNQPHHREANAGTPLPVIKALGILKAFSFISKENTETVDMHRLVQLVAQKWLFNKGRIRHFALEALEIMSDAYPYGKHETREICQKYLPHAKAVLQNCETYADEGHLAAASILHNMAGHFTYRGQWIDAEHYQLQALEIRLEILGQEHPDTLTSMDNLATTYCDQDRWKEAEELQIRLVEISKRMLGKNHLSTLVRTANLTSTYGQQGRWNEAEALEVQVMEASKRKLGREHPFTLVTIHNLASTYYNQGRWKEAEDLQVQVVEISKRVLGMKHPDTFTRIGNLSSTYQKQGRWNEAEELQVQVLKISKRVLGREHPYTLTSMTNLAVTYRNQGRCEKAEGLGVQAMEISKRVLGPEHTSTLTSMSDLALTYCDQDRWKEAERLQVQVVEISEMVLGPEHPDTIGRSDLLALTYCEQGRWEEAEKLQAQVVEISKSVLGLEHPDTLTSMANLASTYCDQGRWKEAEKLQVQVVDLSKRVIGQDHPSTLTYVGNLACNWKEQDRWEEAIQLLRDCVRRRKAFLGLDHPATASSVSLLAEWEEEFQEAQ
ncbi:hypothetical protein EsH8_VII_000129 [Colletotrichum jinshuiense]